MIAAHVLALALSAAPPVDLRADLQRFAARLEQRLATACRPAEPMVFLAGLPETRFVYLDGIGAIFLLPPRSLPPQASVKSDQAKPEISVSGAPTGPQVLVTSDERPSDLTDLEARIRETRKEAERMRAQAEAAFAETERQLMAELRPGLSDSASAAHFPLPWTFFLEDAADDTRAPEQVEKDVKHALVTTILEDSTVLKALQPGDMITVSVELVTRPQPWVRAKPARTVIVRAQKADLDAFTEGKLTKDELLKRVQTKAY
ncbi:MAG: hypothetical protein KBH14_11575 [Vicinamibacteria bacterium]|jgi:hypothetical protein|nr:hypothetical protein [Vicinamibacteria bacterium]